MPGPSGDSKETQPTPARGPQLRAKPPGVARPERPELSDQTPPPRGLKEAMPRALSRAQSMWHLSVTMLFFTIVTMVLTRANLATHLTELLHGEDSTLSTSKLADAAPLVVYVAIGVLLLVAALEWALASLLTRRSQWPRSIMLPLAVVHVAVAAVCTLLIPLEVWQGWLLVAVLVLGALVALAASVRAFAPSVSRWIRSRKGAEHDVDAGPAVA